MYIAGVVVLGVWFTTIVTRSLLFSPVRSLFVKRPIIQYYIECPLCFGTLVGILLAILTRFVQIPTYIFIIPLVSLAAYALVALYDLVEK